VAHVVLYSRPGCHLCDVAREAIRRVHGRHPFAFEEVSIEGDEALELAYGIRIPVVAVDGQERFEIDVDETELAELVRS
jgi:glutaredoxin